jgi:hypothetical protein
MLPRQRKGVNEAAISVLYHFENPYGVHPMIFRLQLILACVIVRSCLAAQASEHC